MAIFLVPFLHTHTEKLNAILHGWKEKKIAFFLHCNNTWVKTIENLLTYSKVPNMDLLKYWFNEALEYFLTCFDGFIFHQFFIWNFRQRNGKE